MPKTMEDAVKSYGARTVERAGAFAPIAEWDKAGEYMIGEYAGMRLIPGANGGKPFPAHFFQYLEGTCEFRRKEEIIAVSKGEVVSVSGQLLDDALKSAAIGTVWGIAYQGEGEKKKGRNPARLFSVREVLAA